MLETIPLDGDDVLQGGCLAKKALLLGPITWNIVDRICNMPLMSELGGWLDITGDGGPQNPSTEILFINYLYHEDTDIVSPN